jgi:imidazolonepropionase-like amidohydrolase
MKTLIKNVNVFDGIHDRLEESAGILINDNLIAQIDRQPIREEEVDQVIEGRGLWAIPGLIDAHVHMSCTTTGVLSLDAMTTDEVVLRSARLARDMLFRGFTTVRDMGSPTIGLKNVIDAKIHPGPRIYPSGSAISQTCGHSDYRQNRAQRNNPITGSDSPIQRHGIFAVADGVPEVLKATREQLLFVEYLMMIIVFCCDS